MLLTELAILVALVPSITILLLPSSSGSASFLGANISNLVAIRSDWG